MKSNLSMIAMGLLIFILSCQSSDQNKQIDQKEIDEITALLTQYSIDWGNAIKNKDASGVEAYFAPDMIYQSGTGNRQLKEDLIREIKESSSIMNSFSIVDLEIKLYSRDLALVTGGGVSNWLDPEGNEHISESRFSNVWIKNGNAWQCIIGHGNTLEKGNSEEDLVKIKRIPEKAESAINNNDFKGWLELFDENALVMFDENENIEGKEQMSEQLSKFWKNVESDYSFRRHVLVL